MGGVPSVAAIAVSRLSEVTGEDFFLVGRLAGGETGAHEVVGKDGRHLVVKWDRSERTRALRNEAVILAERLREEAGWPVPRQWGVADGEWLWVLQDLLPGRPVERLTHAMVDDILRIHDSRLGLARPSDPSHWPEALIETLVVGGDGYCMHQPLRDHDRRSARLVAAVEDLGGRVRPDDLPAGADIIHWDLHPGNLLQDGGRLAGVVDTDFALVGDAAFDLVTAAVSARAFPCEEGVDDRLLAAALGGLDQTTRRAYLGHLLVRVVDWPIRRGRRSEVELWLDVADDLLDL